MTHASCRAQRHGDWPRGNWGPLNIAVMIAGFVIYWPLGLAVLAYNIFSQPGDFRRWTNRARDMLHEHRDRREADRRRYTGNAAFDEYRSETLKRLDEERERLEQEVRDFRAFQEELKRKQDRDEFDRFMADRKPRH